MSKKAALITGIPGTGKSTLARNIMGRGEDNPFKDGIVIGHHLAKITIFGDYSDPSEVFPGTDRMSMAVSPAFQEYIKKHTPNFFVEGDRLVGNGTIDFLLEEGYEVKVWHLTVPDAIVQQRYVQRGSNQDPKFLKSKATKVSNITGRRDLNFDDAVIQVDHITPEDTDRIATEILEFLES